MVRMLITFEAHFAELSSWTDQAFKDTTFDILHSAAFAACPLVGRKAILPPLEIFVDDNHRILEL